MKKKKPFSPEMTKTIEAGIDAGKRLASIQALIHKEYLKEPIKDQNKTTVQDNSQKTPEIPGKPILSAATAAYKRGIKRKRLKLDAATTVREAHELANTVLKLSVKPEGGDGKAKRSKFE